MQYIYSEKEHRTAQRSLQLLQANEQKTTRLLSYIRSWRMSNTGFKCYKEAPEVTPDANYCARCPLAAVNNVGAPDGVEKILCPYPESEHKIIATS